jgi:uncharacterized tellurite resistance protein B-like protein
VKDIEKLELLKAVLAVAAADGQLRRSEMGVAQGLAARIGVGQASFEAMIKAAQRGDPSASRILLQSKDSARTALELLVAEARIDGEIHEKEREFLVHIATQLDITGDEFQSLYQAGLKRADRIRKRRQ